MVCLGQEGVGGTAEEDELGVEGDGREGGGMAEEGGVEGGVSSGSRIMHSWHEIGPPLLNTMSQDLKNCCEGR